MEQNNEEQVPLALACESSGRRSRRILANNVRNDALSMRSTNNHVRQHEANSQTGMGRQRVRATRSSRMNKSQKGSPVSKSQASRRIPEESSAFTMLRCSQRIADWDYYLRSGLKAAEAVCPVDFFQNAPLASIWPKFAVVGSRIEVPHPQSVGKLPVYCTGTIIAFAGYKALIKFDMIDNEQPSMLAWISYCGPIPRPMGFAKLEGCLLLPVLHRPIWPSEQDEDLFQAFRDMILRNKPTLVVDSNPPLQTISMQHERIVERELEAKQGRFKLHNLIEVMDKEEPARNRLACVRCIVGDRIMIRYIDAEKEDQGFCFNMKSELVHELGWSHCVGQTLKNYSSQITLPKFPKSKLPKYPEGLKIQPKMVFELRHPFHPSKIVSGSVKKPLNHGYFVANIETDLEGDPTEFVFHVTSDYILPCGFCKRYNIQLVVPHRYEEVGFSWESYNKRNHTSPLDLSSLPQKPTHRFVKGCKFEAVDICQPSYFGPATVLDIADHLLLMHFDGWSRNEEKCYQWISAFSSDIYPAGWAEMVGHNIESHAVLPIPEDSYYIVSETEGSVMNSESQSLGNEPADSAGDKSNTNAAEAEGETSVAIDETKVIQATTAEAVSNTIPKVLWCKGLRDETKIVTSMNEEK